MNHGQVVRLAARIRARDPRALALYEHWKLRARAGDVRYLAGVRQLRAWALMQQQQQGGGQVENAPQDTSTQQIADPSRVAALVISQVQLGNLRNLEAIQAAAQ